MIRVGLVAAPVDRLIAADRQGLAATGEESAHSVRAFRGSGWREHARRRIARDLHDHLGQQMTALHLQLEVVARQLLSEGSPTLERVREVQKLATQLDKDVHFYTWELRPGALYNLGLVPALTDFVSAFSQAYQIPITFECINMPEPRLQSDHRYTERVSNRHASIQLQ